MRFAWVANLVPILFLGSWSFAAGPKIGFILSTMQEERYALDKKIFEETVQKLGGQVIFASCNNSEQAQAAVVDQVLAQQVQALVIQPVNGDTAGGFAKKAKQFKVPVISYDRLIKNGPVDAYITENSIKVGELQALSAVKFTRAKGNYVLLMGQAGHSTAEDRTAGVLRILKRYPKISIVARQYHPDWSVDSARHTVEHVLDTFNGNIQAIIANNSSMAHAAVEVLEKRKLTGRVFVAGADSNLPSIRDIAAGKQMMDVDVSVGEMARKAAEASMALVKKENFHFNLKVNNGSVEVRTVLLPVFSVSRNQIETRFIKPGIHSREAIYGALSSKSSR